MTGCEQCSSKFAHDYHYEEGFDESGKGFIRLGGPQRTDDHLKNIYLELDINGTHMQEVIEVNYCPNCGTKL